MTPVSHMPQSDPEELSVSVGPRDGRGERLIMLGRPREGRVHVREWSDGNWAGPPAERDLAVDDAYAIFQCAFDERRRLSAGLLDIRAWLDGRTP